MTSGGYGHHVKESIALGYVPAELASPDGAGRRRFRDRDHRPAPAGAAPARADVRPAGSPDAPVTEVARAAAGSRPRRTDRRRRPAAGVRAGRLGRDGDPARRRGARPWRARCAWPATAGTASRRSTASPTCGPARRRPCPGSSSRGIRPAAMPPLPGRRRPDLTATPSAGTRSRSAASRSTSRSSAAATSGRGSGRRRRARRRARPRPGRRRTATRSSAIYAGPTLVVRTPAGMLHVHAARDRRRDRRGRDPPGLPGQRSRGIVTARAAERLHAAGVDLGDAVAVGAAARACRARRSPAGSSGSRAMGRVTSRPSSPPTPRPAPRPRRRATPSIVGLGPRPARPARADGRRRCR